MDRSSCRYRPRPSQDEQLCERLRALAARHPRYGYRRLGALLRREGQAVNHKRVERLYRQEGVAVRRRKRKRLARGTCPRAPANGASESALVFAGLRLRYDGARTRAATADSGRRLHARVFGDRNRHVAHGRRVTAALERMLDERPRPLKDSHRQRTGVPLTLVPSLVRRAASASITSNWANRARLIESFNGRLRDECLNVNLFHNLHHARLAVAAWRIE